MPEWVTTADVEDRWVGAGYPSDQVGVINQHIDDAEEIIRFEYPEIAARIVDADPPDPLPDNPLPIERLQLVICRMVIRVLRNPDGARQTTETEGPFSRNRTFPGDVPGQLELTDQDRKLLGYLPGAPSQRAFTVPMAEPEVSYLGSAETWSPE